MAENEKIEINELANRIREIRAKTGMSQAEFSQLFNIPSRTYEGWEMNNDKHKPPIYTINFLEISVNKLLETNFSNDVIKILQKR